MLSELQVVGKIANMMANMLQQVHEFTGKYLKQLQQKRKRQAPVKVHFARNDQSLPENHLRTDLVKTYQKIKAIPVSNTYNAKNVNKNLGNNSPVNPTIQPHQDSNKTVPNVTLNDINTQLQANKFRIQIPKERLQSVNIPEKPKQPLSPFMRYNRQIAPKVKSQCPDLVQTDLVRVTGAMWKQLSAELKAPYEQQYNKQKMRYEQLLDIYYTKFPQLRPKSRRNRP